VPGGSLCRSCPVLVVDVLFHGMRSAGRRGGVVALLHRALDDYAAAYLVGMGIDEPFVWAAPGCGRRPTSGPRRRTTDGASALFHSCDGPDERPSDGDRVRMLLAEDFPTLPASLRAIVGPSASGQQFVLWLPGSTSRDSNPGKLTMP
jgi:hypothetical protein